MKRLDDMLTEKTMRHGRGLITNFAILVKVTGIYDSMNEAILNTAQRVLKELDSLSGDEGDLSLKMAGESFFIEDTRIKATLADIDNFVFLMKELGKRKIGMVTFKTPLEAEDLVSLAYSIRRGKEATEIQAVLDEKLVKGISVGGPLLVQREESVDLKDTRKISRRAYTNALSSFKDINDSIKVGKRLNIKKAKRACQSLVDCLVKDERYVLGLTETKGAKSYYYNHSTNVAVLSLALGMRVGLSKYHLSKLGISALFHDVGKVAIPLSILDKPSDFTPKERELIEMHPIEGVRQILATWWLNESSILAMVSAFEHHLNLDLTGYPVVTKERKLNLFSRIIRIADDYDSLVSGRVYGRTPLRRPDALKAMYEKRGVSYDETLLRAFIDVISRRLAA